MKGIAESVLLRLAPRWLWRRRIASWPITSGEAEEVLLPFLADPAKTSVDVGCADGAYALHLYLHSRDVVAFEPNPHSYSSLVQLFRSTSKLRLLPYALSDSAGQAKLHMPKNRPNLSSLAHASDEGGDMVEVRMVSLDSLALHDVGLIKIDVEGHEEATLAGARETIGREMPVLLIEIEERHNLGALDRIQSMLSAWRYTGYFLNEGALKPLSQFDHAVHQNPKNISDGRPQGLYINNFLFLPPSRMNLASWPKI